MLKPRKVGMRNPKQGLKYKPAKAKVKAGRGYTSTRKRGTRPMTRRK